MAQTRKISPEESYAGTIRLAGNLMLSELPLFQRMRTAYVRIHGAGRAEKEMQATIDDAKRFLDRIQMGQPVEARDFRADSLIIARTLIKHQQFTFIPGFRLNASQWEFLKQAEEGQFKGARASIGKEDSSRIAETFRLFGRSSGGQSAAGARGAVPRKASTDTLLNLLARAYVWDNSHDPPSKRSMQEAEAEAQRTIDAANRFLETNVRKKAPLVPGQMRYDVLVVLGHLLNSPKHMEMFSGFKDDEKRYLQQIALLGFQGPSRRINLATSERISSIFHLPKPFSLAEHRVMAGQRGQDDVLRVLDAVITPARGKERRYRLALRGPQSVMEDLVGKENRNSYARSQANLGRLLERYLKDPSSAAMDGVSIALDQLEPARDVSASSKRRRGLIVQGTRHTPISNTEFFERNSGFLAQVVDAAGRVGIEFTQISQTRPSRSRDQPLEGDIVRQSPFPESRISGLSSPARNRAPPSGEIVRENPYSPLTSPERRPPAPSRTPQEERRKAPERAPPAKQREPERIIIPPNPFDDIPGPSERSLPRQPAPTRAEPVADRIITQRRKDFEDIRSEFQRTANRSLAMDKLSLLHDQVNKDLRSSPESSSQELEALNRELLRYQQSIVPIRQVPIAQAPAEEGARSREAPAPPKASKPVRASAVEEVLDREAAVRVSNREPEIRTRAGPVRRSGLIQESPIVSESSETEVRAERSAEAPAVSAPQEAQQPAARRQSPKPEEKSVAPTQAVSEARPAARTASALEQERAMVSRLKEQHEAISSQIGKLSQRELMKKMPPFRRSYSAAERRVGALPQSNDRSSLELSLLDLDPDSLETRIKRGELGVDAGSLDLGQAMPSSTSAQSGSSLDIGRGSGAPVRIESERPKASSGSGISRPGLEAPAVAGPSTISMSASRQGKARAGGQDHPFHFGEGAHTLPSGEQVSGYVVDLRPEEARAGPAEEVRFEIMIQTVTGRDSLKSFYFLMGKEQRRMGNETLSELLASAGSIAYGASENRSLDATRPENWGAQKARKAQELVALVSVLKDNMRDGLKGQLSPQSAEELML